MLLYYIIICRQQKLTKSIRRWRNQRCFSNVLFLLKFVKRTRTFTWKSFTSYQLITHYGKSCGRLEGCNGLLIKSYRIRKKNRFCQYYIYIYFTYFIAISLVKYTKQLKILNLCYIRSDILQICKYVYFQYFVNWFKTILLMLLKIINSRN